MGCVCENSYVPACVSLCGPLMLTMMLFFVSHAIKFSSDCLSQTNCLACFLYKFILWHVLWLAGHKFLYWAVPYVSNQSDYSIKPNKAIF